MQTFLPHPNFALSAKQLDMRRLGKQRVECKQILLALGCTIGENYNTSSSWKSHPATRMWKGYEPSLAFYGMTMCTEWQGRGYQDTLHNQFTHFYLEQMQDDSNWNAQAPGNTFDPPWLGDDRVHRSHRSNLIRKDPKYYGPMYPDVPPDLPYFWPA